MNAEYGRFVVNIEHEMRLGGEDPAAATIAITGQTGAVKQHTHGKVDICVAV